MKASMSRLGALVLASAAVVALAGTATASADSTTCGASGSIKLSPGLSEIPQVQNVTIKGSLAECASVESEVTAGRFIAHFKTAEPVTCATLLGAGVGAAAEEDKVVLKWTPKGSGNSQGTFSLPITEVAGASLSGLVSSGPFVEDAISGTVSETYTGGPECGKATGKKKAKKVNKGSLTGSLSIS